VSLPEHLVIDTSAIAALYKEEDDADLYWRHLNDGSGLMLPVASYLECVMVLSRYSESRQWLDALCAEYNIALFGSDARQANLAADAFARYGRGSKHRAVLNSVIASSMPRQRLSMPRFCSRAMTFVRPI
jgi:ribonuclease VapC